MYGAKATSALFNTVARQGVLAKQLTAPKSTAFLSQLPARHVSGKISYTTTTRSTQFSQKPIQQQQQELKEHSAEDTSVAPRSGSWVGAKILLDPAHVDSCVLKATQLKDPKTVINTFVLRKAINANSPTPLSSKTYEAVIDAYGQLRRHNQPLQPMLEAYQEMLDTGVSPSSQTYALLIRSLCARDSEVQRTLNGLRRQMARTGTTTDKLAILEREANLEQAVDIFKRAVQEKRTEDFDVELYNRILQGLSQKGNTEGGIYILSQLEQSSHVKPNGNTFAFLVSMFGAAGDLPAVKECFMEYSSLRSKLPMHDPVYVYNALVSAYVDAGDLKGALNIVEYIMVRDNVNVSILPYNKILKKACHNGNMELVEPLLSQLESDPNLPDPDATTYAAVLSAHIQNNDLESASKVYQQMITKDISREHGQIADYAYAWNQNNRPDIAAKTIEDMLRGGLRLDMDLCEKVLNTFMSSGRNKEAIESLDEIMKLCAKKRFIDTKFQLTAFAIDLSTRCNDFQDTLSLLEILKRYSIPLSSTVSSDVLKKYLEVKNQPEVWEKLSTQLDIHAFGVLYDALFRKQCKPEEFCQFAMDLFKDMKATGVSINSSLYIRVLMRMKKYQLPNEYELTWTEQCESELSKEGSSEQCVLETVNSENSKPELHKRVTESADLLSGIALAKTLEGRYDEALRILQQDIIEQGNIPTADAVRDMIQECTKTKRLDVVNEIYGAVINPLNRLEKHSKQRALTTLYNAMIISHARLAGLEAARVYYKEMQQISAYPSGDAYGTLLQYSSGELPEDCSEAEHIYSEVKKNKVTPTVFLYNVLMSKFSKANRFETVMELLDEMKQAGVCPNSITYSTIISSALRCEKEDVALEYYNIMTASKRYHPRPGPFASFIQYYLQKNLDKEKAMKFYQLSKQYKLTLPERVEDMIQSLE